MDITTIISAIMGLAALIFAGFWANAKGKLFQVYQLGKETLELADASIKAIEDDRITKQELELIKKEAADVKSAWRRMIGKM